jgi:circadian clock protein KaiC
MRKTKQEKPQSFPTVAKSLTGVAGFDAITGGGLPSGRTTLVVGGPGTGKTLFSLQWLINGAVRYGESGIYVTFEESARQVRQNALTFGWELEALENKRRFFLDSRMSTDLVPAGDFDLEGLLVGLEAKAAQIGAKRIVFDSLDVLLSMLSDPRGERREVYRVHEWLHRLDLTGVITVKSGSFNPSVDERFHFMDFMADAVVHLSHNLEDRTAFRHVRVAKYRGSAFVDNRFPLIFGKAGVEVDGATLNDVRVSGTGTRVSTGVARLDAMLEGGYIQGSGILISGNPGTAKSTLAGSFAAAVCRRRQRALYVCFDESPKEFVRNLISVNIKLQSYVNDGLLHFMNPESESRNAEEHVHLIKQEIERVKPVALMVDPVSALMSAGGGATAWVALQRLLRFTRNRGITFLATSLLSSDSSNTEATPVQISTIADVWMHLSYVILSGERNRALTIVKARGTQHSNQVRELTLSRSGVTLSDVFTDGGEVLMGTARWEKELSSRLQHQDANLQSQRRRRELTSLLRESSARMNSVRRELQAQKAELQILQDSERARQREARKRAGDLQRRRTGRVVRR